MKEERTKMGTRATGDQDLEGRWKRGYCVGEDLKNLPGAARFALVKAIEGHEDSSLLAVLHA